MVSSLSVGYLLGIAGSLLLPGRWSTVGYAVVMVVAVLAIVRELGWARLPVPQPLRQTSSVWPRKFGAPVAAVLWGLDLGSTVTSRFTFAGTWVLLLCLVASADPSLAAVALLTFWIGRAVPVWVAPLFLPDAASVSRLMDAIDTRRSTFRHANVFGVVLLAVFTVTSVF